MAKLGGLTFTAAAGVTTLCGLLLLANVAPAPVASPVQAITASTVPATDPPPTQPPPTQPPPSPVPLTVSPTSAIVGPGGVVRISGVCPVVGGNALGPVEIWQIDDATVVLATGITAEQWVYDWQASVDIDAPVVLQAWCGDPAGFAGAYPASLQVAVDLVQTEKPPVPTTTTPVPTTTTPAPAGTIPETR